MATHRLIPGTLRLDTLERWLSRPPVVLELDEAFLPGIQAAEAVVARAAAGDAPVYGVNTGFGKLAKVRIPPEDVTELQRRIVLSHMCGVGPPLDEPTTRLVLLLKASSLALGHSGVRPATIEALLTLLAHDALPLVPAQGSVGASGDLAPLAHLAGVLLGEGEALLAGRRATARVALAAAGIEPLVLGPKEGLALLNGTQVSTALAIGGWWKARRLLDAALLAGAMSVDAALGSDVPFDPRIHTLRRQPGQSEVAATLARLLQGSAIRASHLTGDDRVQDPYSLRCQPQVMGACLDQLLDAGAVLEREANGVSDNPLVFPDTGEILSGGNFHAEPVALAADRIAASMSETGAIAERRIALLTDPALSLLPAFLTPEPRPQLRHDDRPGDRGGTPGRAEAHGQPRRHREPADLGQPGGPCQHGDLCRPPPARHGRQSGAHPRHRAPLCRPGHRLPPPAALEPCAGTGARPRPPAQPPPGRRPAARPGHRAGRPRLARRRAATMTLRRRDLLLAGATLLVPPSLRANETLWSQLRAGGLVLLMRHARTTSGVGDPPGFRLDDCTTQRNLDEVGRMQARAWGRPCGATASSCAGC